MNVLTRSISPMPSGVPKWLILRDSWFRLPVPSVSASAIPEPGIWLRLLESNDVNLTTPAHPFMRRCYVTLCFACLIFVCACSRTRQANEVAYVSAPQAFLRDQVSTVYNKTGTVKNGEQVEVLGRDRRFVRVRTASGVEGWVEQRYLVTKKTYDAFQKLAAQEQQSPVQATGTSRNSTNIHLDPDREAEHLYQFEQGIKTSILKRATSEKNLPGAVPPSSTKTATKAPAAMEDWWLIRDAQGHTGWVLA